MPTVTWLLTNAATIAAMLFARRSNVHLATMLPLFRVNAASNACPTPTAMKSFVQRTFPFPNVQTDIPSNEIPTTAASTTANPATATAPPMLPPTQPPTASPPVLPDTIGVQNTPIVVVALKTNPPKASLACLAPNAPTTKFAPPN